jgi:hypothetical protein
LLYSVVILAAVVIILGGSRGDCNSGSSGTGTTVSSSSGSSVVVEVLVVAVTAAVLVVVVVAAAIVGATVVIVRMMIIMTMGLGERVYFGVISYYLIIAICFGHMYIPVYTSFVNMFRNADSLLVSVLMQTYHRQLDVLHNLSLTWCLQSVLKKTKQ